MDSVWSMSSEQLHMVRGMRISGNRLIVSNGGSGELLLLSLPGGDATVIGRSGQGPGESLYLTDIATRGDSLVVLDGLGHRVHLFTTLDSVRLERTWTLPEAGAPERVFIRPDGRVLVALRTGGTRAADAIRHMEVFRDTVRIVAVTAGRRDDNAPVLTFPGQELAYRIDGGLRQIIPPFATRAYYDFTDRGIVVADGRTGEILVLHWDGYRQTVFPAPANPSLVSGSELEAWRQRNEARAARLPDPAGFRAIAEAALTAWGGQPPRPYYSAVTAGSRVTAVRRYDGLDTETEHWALFDQGGESDDVWHIAPHVRIMGIHGDTVLAVSRDSLGVESLLFLRQRNSLRDDQT